MTPLDYMHTLISVLQEMENIGMTVALRNVEARSDRPPGVMLFIAHGHIDQDGVRYNSTPTPY